MVDILILENDKKAQQIRLWVERFFRLLYSLQEDFEKLLPWNANPPTPYSFGYVAELKVTVGWGKKSLFGAKAEF